MFKIPHKISVFLSLVLTVVLMLAVIGGCFLVPGVVDRFIDLRYPDGQMNAEKPIVMLISYGVLAVVALADVMLFLLLCRVRRGLVFTALSVSYIRMISWCAIACGLLFVALGRYFSIAFVVAAAGIFAGLCVLVVKNVIEEAVEIKAENDLTV